MSNQSSNKKRIVILGTGFAGYSLLKNLKTKLYEVIIVSPRNYFLFTPLLPETTVGTIEFRSIIEPIRVAQPDIEYYQAWCEAVDSEQKVLTCRSSLDQHTFQIAYDHLVIAVGGETKTLGIPGVKKNAFFLKDLPDARSLRRKIIECFERAATPGLGAEQRKQLLHFVVVGGGPTGVEFSAELHDFLIEDLYEWYPDLAEYVHITLFEAAGHLLTTFDSRLSEYAMDNLKKQRIEIRVHSSVQSIEKEKLILADGSEVPYGLILWSTGIGPTPFIQKLKLPKDEQGRLITDEYFHLEGVQGIYAIGDCADIKGQNLPATAQVAQQQGKYLAQAFNRRANNKSIQPFFYKHRGMLAYVGGHRALADFKNAKLRGFTTYLLWRSAYLTKLVGLKNKILVLIDWLKTAIFGRDISRF